MNFCSVKGKDASSNLARSISFFYQKEHFLAIIKYNNFLCSLMKPKKINLVQLTKIIGFLTRKSEKAIGNYLFKGFRIQISKYNLSTNERVSLLYHRRREQGLCIRCKKKVTKVNPSTGKPYRLCEKHRKIDMRGKNAINKR